jgi:GT2 family glycosyltransferase
MTDLSIVIVSYNVRFFTAQCIASLYRSKDRLTKEIIVIDNASEDDSADFIRNLYPEVVVIENKVNSGFSKANNQGFQIAKGKFILILNPDTIVEPDTLQICFDFLERHNEYGATGVVMKDGKGKFLPESKRSLPSLRAGFYKFSGLGKFFPQSAVFNDYYMGNLPWNKDHDIEVLTGAFIFIRKELIAELGGFDEAYFMYGEDIDLSKRILDSGYKIRYISTTGITHFKGESTRKDSFSYIRRFYGAMKIYFKKHHHAKQNLWVNIGITTSVYMLAFLHWVKLFVESNLWLLVGYCLSFLSFLFAKEFWARFYFENKNYFDSGIYYNLALYSFLFSIGNWLTGWFDQGKKMKYLFAGTGIAWIVMLVMYAVLSENLRYSRAIIFIGTIISFFVFWIFHLLLNKWRNKSKTVIIVSGKASGKKIMELLLSRIENLVFSGFVNPSAQNHDTTYIDNIDQLQQVIYDFKPDMVVLNVNETGVNETGKYLITPSSQVRYLLTSVDCSGFIETSESSAKSHIWEAEPVYNLSKPIYRRLKRITEIVFVLIVLLISPVLFFFNKGIFTKIFAVLLNSKVMVSYVKKRKELPFLPVGFFNTKPLIGEVISGEIVDSEIKADICYGKFYTPLLDIIIVYRSIMS